MAPLSEAMAGVRKSICRAGVCVKPKYLLLLFVTVCSWFVAIRCACASGDAFVRTWEFPKGILQNGSQLVAFRPDNLCFVGCFQGRSASRRASHRPILRCLRCAELAPDDNGQADDSRSGSDDNALSRLSVNFFNIEFPSPQRGASVFDSFINSKTRPPP